MFRRRAIGGVRDESLGLDRPLRLDSLNHRPRAGDLGRPVGGGGLYINDNIVFDIDQVIGTPITLSRSFVTRPPCSTLFRRRFSRSHPRSLLSSARLNSARSRSMFASCKRIWIDQISLSFRGGFCPTNSPLFQGARFILDGS